MEDVYSYLNCYGEMDLSVSAFNEVDSLILALISYVEFDGVIPGIESEESITIEEASNRYWSKHQSVDRSAIKLFLEKPPCLLKEVANTKRFGKVRICKYVNRIDVQREKQFSASTFLLEDESAYLAYRGTDVTMVGWKEDFNMSFLSEVPAQAEAVNYLEGTFHPHYKNIRLGGHSKGGNLAIYSSVKCNKEIRDRILSVHNFDGPGFTKEMLRTEAYQEMVPRITNIIPQAAIIGMLLEHSGNRKIIKSGQFGIMQHDAFLWEIEDAAFRCIEELDRSSVILDNIIKEWINKMDKTQRENFVDALFGIFEETGIERVTELSNISTDRVRAFMKSISAMPVEKKEILTMAMNLFFQESGNAVKKEIMDKLKTWIWPEFTS